MLAADPFGPAASDGRRSEHLVPPPVASVTEGGPAGPTAVRPGPTVRVERTATGRTPAHPDPAARAARALAAIGYDWRPALAGWELVLSDAVTAPVGLTRPHDRRIEVAAPPDLTDRVVTHALAHEIGHALDVELLGPDDRAAWLTARGLPGPWWPEEGVAHPTGGPAPGAEDLAEAFALWQLGNDGLSRSVDPLTPAQVALLTVLFPAPASP